MILPAATRQLGALQAGVHTFAPTSALAEGKWVRVSVEQTGICQITDAELRRMGFTDPSKVGVYGFGGEMLAESFSTNHIDDLPEQAVMRDEAGKRLLFFARGVTSWSYSSSKGYVHRNNPYSTLGYYFLHQKEDTPKSIEEVASSTTTPTTYTTTFNDYALHEVDETSLANTGRELYGESFLYTRTRTFKFDLPGLVTGSSTGNRIEYDFAAYVNDAGSTVTLSEGGTQLINSTLTTGVVKYGAARQVTGSATWTPQSEKAEVTITFKPGGTNSQVAMLNFIRINFLRRLGLYDSSTTFRNRTASSYRFEGTAYSDRYRIWNVDSKTTPYAITPYSLDGDLAFSRSSAGGEHVVFSLDNTFPSVTKVEEVANQDLHALEQTDMVIIVQPKLQAQAERLAAYRRSNDGLRVTVVNPQAIYNEFSSGTPDATAYRLLMKMFYDRGADSGDRPQYLLLFGDGAVDNRFMNSSQFKASVRENMLLTYQSDPSLVETESYVCDDYFGFLDDSEGGKTDSKGNYTLVSDVLDLGVGRLPVSTVDQAKAVVTKIIGYSNNLQYGTWKNNLVFLGDDGDNNTHMDHANKLVTLLQDGGHNEFVYTKIYLDAYVQERTSTGYAYPVAKTQFFNQLQQGALIVNYSGHGATTSITHEKIFMLSDAESIVMKRLPVWITATCDFSRFDDTSTSAGEALLLNPSGGAAALFTTTRVVYSDANYSINRELINKLFIKHADGTRYRLGDVMKLSKQALGTQLNKLNFVLLGDPSMTMAYPEYRLAIDEVNGTPTADGEVLTLKALSRVKLKGRVLELSSDTATESDFDGLVYATVYDGEEQVTTLDNASTGKPYVFNDRTRRLYSGSDSVRSGEFELEFVVPRDISYNGNTGLINLYATDKAGREAQGFYNQFVAGGISDALEADTIGPQITALYLNNDSFRDGQTVGSTPYLIAELEDETGINTTGLSIGHDLTAIIRKADGTVVARYDLNDYFTSQPGHSSSGTVGYSIPTLADGSYTLELRAWDFYNNVSSRTISFSVNSATKPAIYDLRTNVNPAREEVTFLLTHDNPEATMKVRIQVYTQMGQCVYDNQVSSMSEYGDALSLTWDLCTSSGSRVQPGIYIYRALLSADGKHYATKSRKLIVAE